MSTRSLVTHTRIRQAEEAVYRSSGGGGSSSSGSSGLPFFLLLFVLGKERQGFLNSLLKRSRSA